MFAARRDDAPGWLRWQARKPSATQVREHFQQFGTPIDIAGICQGLGIRVERPVIATRGIVIRLNGGAATFSIARDLPDPAARIYMAYGLARVLLFANEDRFPPDGNEAHETEFGGTAERDACSEWALDLMAPPALVKKLLGIFRSDYDGLAAALVLPYPVTNWRLRKMGLLSG